MGRRNEILNPAYAARGLKFKLHFLHYFLILANTDCHRKKNMIRLAASCYDLFFIND